MDARCSYVAGDAQASWVSWERDWKLAQRVQGTADAKTITSRVSWTDGWDVFAHRKGSVYKTGYGGTGGKEVAFSWDQGPTRVDRGLAMGSGTQWHRLKCAVMDSEAWLARTCSRRCASGSKVEARREALVRSQ